MNRQPLLLLGAGLLTLSVCWVVVFAVTMQRVPTQGPAIALTEPSPVASSGAPSTAEPRVVVETVEPRNSTADLGSGAPTSTARPLPTVGPSTPSLLPLPTPTPSLPPLPTPADTPTPAATQTPPPPTAPPTLALTCANGVDNGGGTGTVCEVVIGPESATVLECHGAAGDPRAACSTTIYSGRVTTVEACKGTANGGGAVLLCSVTGVGVGSASVTLCVGTGAGGTLVGLTCTGPETSAVAVFLCNGSGNGGGALIVCSVD